MNSDFSAEKFAASEYEVQHYGFSSSDFENQFLTEINQTIKSILDDMEKCIAIKLNLNEEKANVLKNEIFNLTTRYRQIAEKSFETHVIDVRNYFSIPPNVLLECDKIHENHATQNNADLQSEIDRLEKEYLKEKCLLVLYQQELDNFKRVESLQQQLQTKRKQMKTFQDALKQRNTIKELSERYEKTIDRLKDNCVVDIRPKLDHLKYRHMNQKTGTWTPLTFIEYD